MTIDMTAYLAPVVWGIFAAFAVSFAAVLGSVGTHNSKHEEKSAAPALLPSNAAANDVI